jgi:hypothetical protein
LRSLLPGGEEVTSIYDYQMVAAKRAGVRFEHGVHAGLDEVKALRADAVVLAAGATMVAPLWLPQEAAGLVPDLRAAMAELAGVRSRQRGAAVIFDMDHGEGTYAAAERLSELFERVVILTPRDSLAVDTSLVTRQGILRRLAKRGIESIFLSEPRWSDTYEEGVLEYQHLLSGAVARIPDLAFLAYSTPRARNDGLAQPLKAAGIDVHVVGDCLSPRDLLAATAEGHAAGNTL